MAQTTFGIPYASAKKDANGYFVLCPTCQLRIELRERKDFESFTLIEYQHHHMLKHMAEAERDGDPAFIYTREEALEIKAEEPSLYIPDDVTVFYLCDGVLLWGDPDKNIFYDGPGPVLGATWHRASWFEQDRANGRRPIIAAE